MKLGGCPHSGPNCISQKVKKKVQCPHWENSGFVGRQAVRQAGRQLLWSPLNVRCGERPVTNFQLVYIEWGTVFGNSGSSIKTWKKGVKQYKILRLAIKVSCGGCSGVFYWRALGKQPRSKSLTERMSTEQRSREAPLPPTESSVSSNPVVYQSRARVAITRKGVQLGSSSSSS